MRTTKLRILSAAGIAVSLAMAATPAWSRDNHYRHTPHYKHSYRQVVVMPPPVVHRYRAAPVYYAPPAPVHYAPPARVYYAPPAPVYVPAPTYYAPAPHVYAPLGAVGGAVAGAVIGGGLGHGDVGAIAVGSVLGAIVGDSLDRRY
ncbi:MAG: hypothetical protein HY661_03380 [Betaproteobacteria bacterium]|nr:hypothetical protein [Betaproteobacteria bacterium]